MISKMEAVEKLKQAGFDAANVDGCVMIFTDVSSKEFPKVEKSFRKILQEIGYESSFGISGKKKSE